MDRLPDFRRRIDDIDEQLVKLLNVRASIALEIGRIKHANGEPIYQPGREAEVLAHVREANKGPLDEGAVTRLFERIIDEARRLERLADQIRAIESDTATRVAEKDRGE
jgi:chorismate mutase